MFNYFIVSRSNNKMVFFYCKCGSEHSSQGIDHDPDDADMILERFDDEEDITEGRNRQSLLESTFEFNRQRQYEMDANDCDSPSSAAGYCNY